MKGKTHTLTELQMVHTRGLRTHEDLFPITFSYFFFSPSTNSLSLSISLQTLTLPCYREKSSCVLSSP